MKSLLLLVGLGSAGPAAAAEAEEAEENHYIDSAGKRVELDRVYEGWFGDDRYHPHYWRAVAENAILLGFELFVYWYEPDSSVVDWQFPDLKAKFTDGVIAFDDNMHKTNWLLHPLAGGAHYGLSRVNGLGIPASFAAAAVSSILYESVLEWREITSINDLIVTPVGGMAVGEFLHQLGNYLNSERQRPLKLHERVGPGPYARRLGERTLGLPRFVHNLLDEPPQPPAVADDRLGLSSAYHHRFRLLFGHDFVTSDEGEIARLGVFRGSAEIAAMPGFLRPGVIDTWFWAGNFTALDTRSSFDHRMREATVDVDARLFGHFGQDLKVARGGARGTAHVVASRTALHYVDRWLFDRRDHYAILHVMGPAATLWLLDGPVMIELTADVAPDFAALRSLAYPEWVARFGDEGTKSSLLRWDYYNAWGGSAGVGAAISAEGLTASARGRFGHYESIDGLERNQHLVTREVHADDDVLEAWAAFTYEPERLPVSASIEGAHAGRRSRMPPITARRYDQRLGVSVGFQF